MRFRKILGISIKNITVHFICFFLTFQNDACYALKDFIVRFIKLFSTCVLCSFNVYSCNVRRLNILGLRILYLSIINNRMFILIWTTRFVIFIFIAFIVLVIFFWNFYLLIRNLFWLCFLFRLFRSFFFLLSVFSVFCFLFLLWRSNSRAYDIVGINRLVFCFF